MRRTSQVIAVTAIVILAAQAVQAIPPPPDVIERWAREGRLDELAAIEEQARQQGVNNVPVQFGLKAGAAPIVGQRQAVVILVDFADNEADLANFPAAHFEDMLFSVGSYSTGSLREYYAENSYGQLDLTGTVVGWYRMPEDYAYYTNDNYGFGAYPRNAQKLAEHAIQAADPYVDFSQFDNDGPDGIPDSGDDDGYVDALFVVHAGREGAGGNGTAIWSHAWSTRTPVAVDGVYAFSYSMEPEEGKVGVFAHELGHVFGLPDLYDTGYDSAGLGDWSLMASGSWGGGGSKPVHFDAWSKVKLGWVQPVVPEFNEVGVQIPSVEENAVVYKLWTDGNPGNEYFLMEFRKQVLFDQFIPWKGLVVYHVDDSRANNNNQRCGSGSPHYKVAVEQADGACDLENNVGSGDACDPFPGLSGVCVQNYTFDAFTNPASRAYDDTDTHVALRNIAIGGGVITLDLDVEQAVTAVGESENFSPYDGPLVDLSNPFEPGASIMFYVNGLVGRAVPVRLGIYDVRGRKVRTLAEGARVAGPAEVVWDGRDERSRPAPSGVYFVTLETGGRRTVRKLVLAR